MLRTVCLWLLVGALPVVSNCSDAGVKSASTHRRRRDGNIVLAGPSRAYVIVEPAATAPAEQTRTLLARVTFDERHMAVVGPPVTGRVSSVEVVPGDPVKKGDVLLKIHSADVAKAQAELAEAKQARSLAEKIAGRAALLVEQGAGSEAERQQAEASLAQAQEEQQRAERAIAAIGGKVGGGDYLLRSPIGGTVVERNVEVGNAVAADQGQPLLTIADLSRVWVVADVFEPALPFVHVGDRAVVTVSALPSRNFEGEISHVGDVVNAETRSARARIQLDNASRELRPGMFARVEVRSAQTATVEIPSSAVLAQRDEFYVFVQAKDGSFERRSVEVGAERGQHTTINKGLTKGELVVTEGAILLDAEANAAL